MSEDSMDFLDIMVRKGPCHHCGVDYTPLWRAGPPEKPILCNACGSRWKTKGSLEDYVPKHAIEDAHINGSKLLPGPNPTGFAPQHEMDDAQSGKSNISFSFGSNSSGHGQGPFIFGAEGSYGGTAVSGNITQTQNEEANKAPVWDPDSVSRKKRSILEQRVLSPTERLHQQLYIAMQEQSDNHDDEDPENVLIFERINKYIPENEIGLGCMLLKPPPSPPKTSKSEPDSVSSAAAAAPPRLANDSTLQIENASGLIYVPPGSSSGPKFR